MLRALRNVWMVLSLILMLAPVLKADSVADQISVKREQVAANSTPSTAVTVDVMSLIKREKEVIEPLRPSIQKIIITRSERGEKDQNIVLQAFKKLADGKRRLMIVLQPVELKGTAFLVWESTEKQTDIMWIYLPDINRVKKMLGLDQYDPFFGTLFTYSDLGFVKLHGKYTLLGEEQYEGKKAYRVEEIPLRQDYYSRIISWVAADSMLPMKRDFYNAGNQLWKTEFFKDVTVIDGIPTPIRILMSLVEGRMSTELKVAEINYDVNIPDELFDPNRLSTVATHPIWKSYKPRPVKEQ